MSPTIFRVSLGVLGSAAAAASMGAMQITPQDSPALVERAKAIHERVITADTHNDISPNNFTPECNYTMRLTNQVNLPKMVEGGLDVSFMIVYVGQGPLTPEGFDNAYRQAVAKFDAVHALTEKIAPDKIGLALTADDVRKIAASGRKVAVIGIENGYPIGEDIKRVKEFYDRGGRYMSLAHNGNSQLADSNSVEASGAFLYNNGLSDLGKQVIAEMNKWGIMVDISHPSKGANMQAIALSKAPVIASHSGARAMANHSRNIDDELLAALKKNGGVVQTVAFASYVKVDPAERAAALTALRQEFGLVPAPRRRAAGPAVRGAGLLMLERRAVPVCLLRILLLQQLRARQRAAVRVVRPLLARVAGAAAAVADVRLKALRRQQVRLKAVAAVAAVRGGGQQAALLEALTPERRAEYDRKLAEIDKKWPAAGRATVKDFVDHIDYLVKKIGIDHVGVSSDFDGGGGVTGWNSAAETFNVTLELVRRGYTEEQIGKIWSGNLLRVWAEVEKVAKQIQSAK